MGITITSLLLSSKSSLIPISDPDTLPPFLSLSQQHGCQKDMVHVSTILHGTSTIIITVSHSEKLLQLV